MREISLFSDITPVIVMPSNWIRFVHPRETTGDILEYPELAATMDRDPLSNSSNVSNFFPSREIEISFLSLSLEIFPKYGLLSRLVEFPPHLLIRFNSSRYVTTDKLRSVFAVIRAKVKYYEAYKNLLLVIFYARR